MGRSEEDVMSQTLEELELHALRLPAEEKARLALHLLESLEPSDTGDLEDAWRREAELRLDALESGAAQTVSAGEVFVKP
jgi:putative addiction module component (TIGR02574 family)